MIRQTTKVLGILGLMGIVLVLGLLSITSSTLPQADVVHPLHLIAPQFVVPVAAQLLEGTGTAFPADQAGICSYVNVDQPVDLAQAATAFSQILELGQNYAIGIVQVNNVQTTSFVHVYVDTDGNIIAYFNRTDRASELIKWSGMNFGLPTVNFTTNAAIGTVCSKINVSYSGIEDQIGYYHFGYPDATNMIVFINAIPGGYGTEYAHLSVPANCSVKEMSYSLIGGGFWHSSPALYVDGTLIDQTSGLKTGTYTLTWDRAHTIQLSIGQNDSGVGSVLIYKGS